MITVAPRLIGYANIRWNPDWCKRCLICVGDRPRQALTLRDDTITEVEGRCDQTGLCQRLCPDLAIDVIEPRSRGVFGNMIALGHLMALVGVGVSEETWSRFFPSNIGRII